MSSSRSQVTVQLSVNAWDALDPQVGVIALNFNLSISIVILQRLGGVQACLRC
ncbi:MAG: hypothetical protein ACI8XO_000846 [Verrucomicrobiales bacterium]|jgi:hypothetical protein